MRHSPVLLCILDGWGHREDHDHNAIAAASTPHWNRLLETCPHTLLETSGLSVGLPEGQMGNSEVGHMNIGSGRIVMQDLPRIDQSIQSGELAHHPLLLKLLDAVKAKNGTLHVLGLVSDGGVHAHIAHIKALARIAQHHGVKLAIHAFTDGRDTPPQSALHYLKQLENLPIATVSGRYYAMDRDQRWDRVSLAYEAIANGKGERAATAMQAVKQSYGKGKHDEFVLPTVISDYQGIKDSDGLLMANFRADRAREILQSLVEPEFKGFAVRPIQFSGQLGMVEYSNLLNEFLPALFPAEKLDHILAQVISEAGLKQLHIAETEKYAHVTFFFNGGREAPFEGEERILVPSPKVATYDLKPEMSAPEVTEKLVEAIKSGRYDFIVANYANTDMVGHTGIEAAAKKAVEAVDAALGKLDAAITEAGGVMIISADHGNAEQMKDFETHEPHTAHTTGPVPCVVSGLRNISLQPGKLCDIAPTILQLMALPQPREMTGKSLISTVNKG